MSTTGWSGLERPHTRCGACGARLDAPGVEPRGAGAAAPLAFAAPAGASAAATAAAGAAAAPLEAFATLRVVEGEILREDLCPGCFAARDPRPDTFWKRPLAAACADDPDDGSPRAQRRRHTSALRALFERLAAADAAETEGARQLRYLAALALCRQRKLDLVEASSAVGGEARLVVRRKKDPRKVLVSAPSIAPSELERLLSELTRELERA